MDYENYAAEESADGRVQVSQRHAQLQCLGVVDDLRVDLYRTIQIADCLFRINPLFQERGGGSSPGGSKE